MLHPVFMTSTYSKTIDLSFDPATGERVVVQGKLIKKYLNVAPFKLLLDPEQAIPQV